MFDKLLGAQLGVQSPSWIMDIQMGFPMSRSNTATAEYASTLIFALRVIVGFEEVLTKKGKQKRSITEDQASVYRQLVTILATAGVDGSSCLKFIICSLAEKQRQQSEAIAEKQGKHNKTTIPQHEQMFSPDAATVDAKAPKAPKKATEPKKKSNKNKKKKDKSSLIADIAASLLLPKANQPLTQYVEAARSETAESATATPTCGERYDGCPAALTTVLHTLLHMA